MSLPIVNAFVCMVARGLILNSHIALTASGSFWNVATKHVGFVECMRGETDEQILAISPGHKCMSDDFNSKNNDLSLDTARKCAFAINVVVPNVSVMFVFIGTGITFT